MKTLLYFGIYDRNYSRTKVIQHGFERNGWKVDECHVDPKENRGILKYIRLFLLGLKARRRKHDLVIVGFPGHTVVWLARLIFGKKIIFDAFLSLYDSNVFDRKTYAQDSLRAKKDRWLDTWSCRLAGKVLLDTRQHIGYFVTEFGLPREKFERIWISADDTVFFPQDEEDERFTVHFHGTFIPLQGIKYIIEAAEILQDENILFRIVGSGQESQAIRNFAAEKKLENLEFTGKVPLDKIPAHMARAHIVLGIFGDTEKTKRVIPNKVYEAMAMGKTIVTADTPAIHELPDAEQAFLLVSVANSSALAEAIRSLKRDETKRVGFGMRARQLFQKECLPEHMIADFLKRL